MTDHEAAVAIFKACRVHDPVLPPPRTTVDVEARDERHAKATVTVKESPTTAIPKPKATRPRLPVAKPAAPEPAPVKPVPNPNFTPREHCLAHAIWNCHKKQTYSDTGKCLIRDILNAYNWLSDFYRLKAMEPSPFKAFFRKAMPKAGNLQARFSINGKSGPAVKITGNHAALFVKTRIGIELPQGDA